MTTSQFSPDTPFASTTGPDYPLRRLPQIRPSLTALLDI